MTRRPAKSRRRTGRGVILMIACLLVVSSAMRVATGMGAALASDAPDPAELVDTTLENQAPHDAPIAEAPRPRVSRSEMASLLDALRDREARAQERERRIEMRTKALAVADEEIQKRLTALAEAEARLRATLALANTAAEDDLTRLTSVYENMKPKDAAAVFEQMEAGFAAGFLGRMRPDVAASVMAGLSPEKAYSISVILAGRNANVPKT